MVRARILSYMISFAVENLITILIPYVGTIIEST